VGMVANEPSMEDILSSIKRIIADGSDRTPPARGGRRRPAAVGVDNGSTDAGAGEDAANAATGDDDGESMILELTNAVSDEIGTPDETDDLYEADVPFEADTPFEESEPMTSLHAVADPAPTVSADAGSETASALELGIISDQSAQAARQSLSHLSALLIRPDDGAPNTLEGLVREMLKPMLKQWLDERLPELVEVMVKKEIDRITGRLG